MKPIETEEEKKRKEKKRQIVLTIFLIGVLVLSALGYSLLYGDHYQDPSLKEVSLNGTNFIYNGKFWETHSKGKNYRFFSDPISFNSVNVDSLEDWLSYGETLYLNSASLAEGFLLYNLEDFISRYQLACLEGDECENEEYPIKSCNESNIVVYKYKYDSLRIRREGKCVYLEGGNIQLLSDALSYHVLKTKGIIS
ncbi:MAG: hypothetical protein QW273_03105 [Candidatus Pacearchaeota archaeon]